MLFIKFFRTGCTLLIIEATVIGRAFPQQFPDSFRVIGWTDDHHYLVTKTYPGGVQENLIFDIRTGDSQGIENIKTDTDLLLESLPSGMIPEAGDVISDNLKQIIFQRDNDLYHYSSGINGLRRLTDSKSAEINVSFSPDNTKIAYTRDKDLYVCDLLEHKEIRLTFDASDRIYNGYASWVYMEEILGRESNYAAFWWSDDGTKIAFLRTDETNVQLFTINRQSEEDDIHGQVDKVPYPKAGDPPPEVKMGIADIKTGKISWISTGRQDEHYIAWPFWTPDSKYIAIQVLNRDQNELAIILADAVSGDYRQIYHETSKTWVEFHKDIYVMNNNSGFIIRSSRNGWENLSYYGWDGRLNAQLTDCDFRVNSIERVDEVTGTVYFYATGYESTDKHLFRVELNGKNLVQLTSGRGEHLVSISGKGSYFIDSRNSISDAGSVTAYDKHGIAVKDLYKSIVPDDVSHLLPKTEMTRVKTSDGLFDIPVLITYPLSFDPSKKYPVIFTVYGGPDRKDVMNKWPGDFPSWYALNNIITVKADHRGSGHFGRKGLDYLYRSLGKWELSDYSDVVRWLYSLPYTDKTMIGIKGYSYGGYLTCLALTRGAPYWTHGFASSPVTDFRLYDNVYSERYMDTPEDNKVGYSEGSVLTFAGNLRGKLYITHGDIDDNVHMQNSIYLISRLQDEGKNFRFMLYPGNRHSIIGLKGYHLINEEHNFWLESFSRTLNNVNR